MKCYNQNGDNMDFKYEQITINYVTFDIIIDKEGTKWYPFTKVLKGFLKDEDANKYINTSFDKYLRLWPVKNPTPLYTELWYINEKGLVRYLKNTKVNPYSDKTIKKRNGFTWSLDYFGIERQERNNTYTVVKPTKKNILSGK